MENVQHREKFQSLIQSHTPRQKQTDYFCRLSFVRRLLIANFLPSLFLVALIPSGSIFASDEIDKMSKHDSTLADSIAVSRVEYDGSTLTFNAISNGCTQTDHFKVGHELHEGQCRLEIVRTKQDYCRAVPMPISVSIAWPLPGSCEHGNLILANRLLTSQAKILNPQNKLLPEPKSEKPSLNKSGYLKKP